MWEKFEGKVNKIVFIIICLIIVFKIFVYDQHISEVGRFLKIDNLAKKTCYIDDGSGLIEVKALHGGINTERKSTDYYKTINIKIYSSSKNQITNAKFSIIKENGNEKNVLRKWGYEFEIEFINDERLSNKEVRLWTSFCLLKNILYSKIFVGG